MRICEGNNPEDTKVSEEGVSGCFRCQSRDSPVICGEDHDDAGCPQTAHGGPHTASGRDTLKEAAACGAEPMLEWFFWQELWLAEDPR